MDLHGLAGNTLISYALFWFSITVIVAFTLVTVFTIFYHNYLYPNRLSARYDRNYRPRCSIIIPCKGIPKNFQKNISSFLTLDYDPYEVIFTVQSRDDSAVPAIRKLMRQDQRISLVVAGIATACSQKNHNMLAAIENAHGPDVYVFADSDIQPEKNWLSDMVSPLSKPDITVATGFRWLYSATGRIGELTNAYQNAVILVLFSIASFINNVGLWGGSMAIRKKDFDDLGVREYWAQTVVDDFSLSRLIRKNSKKSVMVSSCITPTDDALDSVKRSIVWFQRQVMFLKAYQKSLWCAAIPVVALCLFLQLLLPISLTIGLCTDHTFLQAGGAAAVIFSFGSMTVTPLFFFLGKSPSMTRTVLVQPLSLFTVLFGVLRTAFTNTISWSGFAYTVNFRGKVTSVKQLSS